MKKVLLNFEKKAYLLFAIICISLSTTAQSLQWVQGMGSAGGDNGNVIKTDATGSVISGGAFSNTVDFNTTAATNSLVATSTYTNGYVLKQTAAGVFTWVQGFVGAGVVAINDITTDATGNVYVTGGFTGNIDFNPGAGVTTLTTTSLTDYDMFICKLTSAGAFVWVKQIGNNYNDIGTSIALDASNNVFIGGFASAVNLSSTLVVDLNPGVAVNSFTINGVDATIVKLDNAGNFVTAQNFGGIRGDYIYSLKIDASNNVIIGGNFDTSFLTLGNPLGAFGSGFIAKLNNSLVSTWAIRISPTTTGNAKTLDLELDAAGNVYATGEMMTEGPGNTYYVQFAGVASTFTVYTARILTADFDAFLTKVDANGVIQWAKNVGFGRNNSRGTDISLDGSNNIYLIGYYKEWIDFNYGGVPYYRLSVGGTSNDYFISKYNSNGVFSNDAQSYGNGGDDYGNSIQATSTGDYYITGQFGTIVNFSPYTATNTLTVVGANDIFIAKYSTCAVPAPPTALTPTLITMCANTTTVQSVASIVGNTYTWYAASYPGSSLGTGASFTTPVITVSGDYWAQATNTCAPSGRTQFSITVSGAAPVITVTASSSSICAGQSTTLTASGATSYLWSGGLPANSSVVASPAANTTYSILGTNGTCNGTQTISIVVNASPTVAVNNTTTCSGTSVNLSATGATTYSWNTGATTSTVSVAPTSNAIYTVTGTTTGCSNTKTVSVTVTGSPTVSVNNVTICAGSPANVSVTGATTYNWNTGATTSSISVSPTITTNYSVTGTTSGCSNTKTVSVIVNPLPNLSVVSTTICAGSTGTLAASGASTYTWNTGSNAANLSVNPVVNTNYTVTGTSAFGCVKTATASVTVGSAPSIAASNQSICVGATATLIASGVSTYTWSTASNSPSISVSPSLGTTVYTVSGNLVGCASATTKTVSVVVNALPVVALANISSPLCVNSPSIALVGTPLGGVYGGIGVSGASFNPASSGAGTFSITYNYTDANNCSAIDAKTATVSLCTSLVEALNTNVGVIVSPNPNNGEFTLTTPELGTYTIVNSIGQTVKVIDITETSQVITINDLPQGIYYIVGNVLKIKIIITN